MFEPIVELITLGVPLTEIAGRARGVVSVGSLFRSIRYRTEAPLLLFIAARAKPLSPPAISKPSFKPKFTPRLPNLINVPSLGELASSVTDWSDLD